MPIMGRVNQYVQFEAFQNKVDDTFIKLGCNQSIKTHDGYVFPLDFTAGLLYLRLQPFIDSEWDKIPYFITSNTDWDPTIYDNSISDSTIWYGATTNEGTPLTNPNFDQRGIYKHRTVVKHFI